MSRLRSTRTQTTAQTNLDEGASWGGAKGLDVPHRQLADWSRMADEQIMRRQLRTRFVKALRELPLIYRVPVVLRDIQGLSTEEASAVLHVKDQTLKSRLHRGRLILRQQLADFATGLTLHHATV